MLAPGEVCLRAWGEFKRESEMLALGEVCFQGIRGREQEV